MPAAIDLLVEDPEWDRIDLLMLVQCAADAALSRLGLDPDACGISVLACDDSRIAALNADFRGKLRATNVLSWPSQERASETPGAMPILSVSGDPCELGDIALASGVCKREAATLGIPLAQHVTHLVVHGILHLLGFDHEHDADAALMERFETEILASVGLPDPYCDGAA